MTAARATYRLQFRSGMDFAKAATLAHYLARLGISHLYASPVFEAASGSTHGYDVIRYDRVDPALGDEAEFLRMASTLHEHGIGLLLDIVPNHMGATPENPWWRDVLEWGALSPFARHFDVDWDAEKLIIPTLGDPYGEALENGVFSLTFDVEEGSIDFVCPGTSLPLNPATYSRVLGLAGNDALTTLSHRFAVATPETAPELKAALAEALWERANVTALEAAARRIEQERPLIHDLHEAQIWRLTFWRAARERLTYRRFFEVSELVGVRVELPSVFEDVHRLVLSWLADGQIDGVRVDHIDGLADPKAYLDRLKASVPESHACPIWVEKILGPDETLRDEWQIAGTSGYEFMRALGGLLTEASGREPLTERYHAFADGVAPYETMLSESKRRVLIRNLAGELDFLTTLLLDLARRDLITRDFGRDTLRRSLIELSVNMPVYRTYVDVDGPRAEDDRLIAEVADVAKLSREVENERALDFITRIWRLEVPEPEQRVEALAFVTRLQQTTGPLMAKAIEDTLFYRYNRLLALNEVGGEPEAFGTGVDAFHDEMQERLAHQPEGLVATATHDTKRGEDARARLYVLSEAADLWGDLAERWRDMNAHLRTESGETRMPSANEEWMLYQALLGAWPIELAPDDPDGLAQLADRMALFTRKALREAKVYSTWTAPDQDYEAAVEAFVRGILDLEKSREFLEDFHTSCRRFVIAGTVNSFAQTLLKLTVPGVPDIYQGSELWDFSLVDPDNRSEVDFAARAALLDEEPDYAPLDLLAAWRSGAIKLRIIREALQLRRETPELFTEGAYEPLEVAGEHAERLVAFRRSVDGTQAIVIVPRSILSQLGFGDMPLVSPDAWGDTEIRLGEGKWRDRLTGIEHDSDDGILLASALFDQLPVALLTPVGGLDPGAYSG